MATTKRKSRILDEVHETALGLHSAGIITKRRMSEFDALCHLDVKEMAPRTIRLLRKKSHVSQAVFASLHHVSKVKAIRWEKGR
jgi:putative transcriptional regulator